MSVDPIEIVQRFLATWAHEDTEELLTFFATNGIYHNIPMDPWTGHAEIRRGIDAFFEMAKGIDFEVLNIAAAGSVVFTERIDRFDLVESGHLDMPVVGVFEVANGKITAWRDYFDMAMFTGRAKAT